MDLEFLKQIIKPTQFLFQQKRFKSKINVQKPRKPHYTRALMNEFLTPFYEHPNKNKDIIDLCSEQLKRNVKERIYNPYEKIIAREILNWFVNSKMVAFLHKNSIKQEDVFEVQVPLKRNNMYLKSYSFAIVKLALKDSPYAAVLPLMSMDFYVVFSPETNVAALEKILKKEPRLILMAGILENKLLNLQDFLKYGKMDLTTSRSYLVQTIQNAGGNNLNRQLTHHSSTLVTRLNQICKKDEIPPEDKE